MNARDNTTSTKTSMSSLSRSVGSVMQASGAAMPRAMACASAGRKRAASRTSTRST